MNQAFTRFVENDKNIETLVHCMNDGVLLIDNHMRIIAVNPAFEQMTHFSCNDVLNQPIRDVLIDDGQTVERLFQSVMTGEGWSGDIRFLRHEGESFWSALSITKVEQQSGICYYIGIMRDISEKKAKEEKLTYLSNYDQLTKLPNRHMLMVLAESAIRQEEHESGRLDILFFDLDRFEKINKNYGYEMGDQLILQVAQRLRHIVGESIVSRVSGDEFIILLKNYTHTKTLEMIEQIFRAFERPFAIGNHTFIVTISMGVSSFPENGGDVTTLLQNADSALFHAKMEGRNHYVYYRTTMNDRVGQELALEQGLFEALKSDELEVFYQLQVDVETSEPYGVEALVRWNHPTHGVMAPGVFLPIAEEMGILAHIDEWVLNQACSQGKKWHDAGRELVVSVNVSKAFFKQPDFIKRVEKALMLSDLEPDYLCLEITENTAALQVDDIREKLRVLKGVGIHVSLDDFGTGYSSLSQLNLFPIDTLKIDQSFVRGEPSQTKNAIVRLIIGMAKTLGVSVICEGVETEEQLQLLKDEGCKHAQGYYFSKPVPSAQCEALMRV
ncbi:bifunctional diguanylate cyclase/phosphodiesterase [Halalkalibacter sp. APA_J-10(15)]|uniref:putative bifunctional diguanylate cyclase/phosphodiesterase n=1 Tax=Halalkalibacter sp. APA_J-10(15) TaxID=2933805 RepID=UPI001FF2160A|nr:GGDEF domain-containing phosphodiesterase [Halalkalibacter sp. APA_J-10(15)]MCK0470064.1 EAL domain-containing protein [Halalkalibacter sp. APA_J-10(15)]